MTTVLRSLALVHLQRHAPESALVLERQSPTEIAGILRSAPAATAAGVLAHLSPGIAGACLEQFSSKTRRLVVTELPVATAATVLRRLSESAREDVLAGISPGVQRPILRALRFPSHTAGALANMSAPTLRGDDSVRLAIQCLRDSGEPLDSRVFVLDRSERVIGSVSAGTLLLANPDATVRSLRLDAVRTAPGTVSVAVLSADERYRGGPLAVVDSSSIFVGVLPERALRATAMREPSRPAIHLAVAFGELFWLGLCEMSSGFMVQPRTAGQAHGRAGGDD